MHGIIRRSSSFNTGRIDHLYTDPLGPTSRLFLHYGDLMDPTAIARIVEEAAPDEVYHLGAQSHVRVSYDIPEYTGNVTALRTTRLLEAIREAGTTSTRFYQASSSEMFGVNPDVPTNERSESASPYAAAKVYAFWMAVNYREAYGMFCCNGILFNHESERRGETFVTRKIVRGEAFTYVGLDWREHVRQDPRYFRPVDPPVLLGDASKARERLGWTPRVAFRELVRSMVDAELSAAGIPHPAGAKVGEL